MTEGQTGAEAPMPQLPAIIHQHGAENRQRYRRRNGDRRQIVKPAPKAEKIRLRPYQQEALEAIEGCSRSCSVVMATGGGKTVIFGELAIQAKKTLVLCNTNTLCRQTKRRLASHTGKRMSSVQGAKKDWSGEIIVGSAKTLARNLETLQLNDLDLVIVDEAHHYQAPTFHALLSHIQNKRPDLKMVGFTATPDRADGTSLHPAINHFVYQWNIADGVQGGYLVPPKVFSFHTGYEEKLMALRLQMGEVNMRHARGILDKPELNAEIVTQWARCSANRQTVAYTTTIEHGQALLQHFLDAGIPADMVHCRYSDEENETVLAAYERGEINVVINCLMLTEGWDSPVTSAVILARPMTHSSTAEQAVGRGLQPRQDDVQKDDCLILDFAAVMFRHTNIGGYKVQIEDCDTYMRGRGDGPPRKKSDEIKAAGIDHIASDEEIYTDYYAYNTETIRLRPIANAFLDAHLYTRHQVAFGGLNLTTQTYAFVTNIAGMWTSVCINPSKKAFWLFKTLKEALEHATTVINWKATHQMRSARWMAPDVPPTDLQTRLFQELAGNLPEPNSRYEMSVTLSFIYHADTLGIGVMQAECEAEAGYERNDDEQAQTALSQEHLLAA